MKKIKYFTVMAAALLLGFSSCSNDENAPRVDDSLKSVTVRISKPSTYADNTNEEESAVGKTPDLNDVDVFFIGAGIVRHKGTMVITQSEIPTIKTFNNVPGSADKVVIIANAKALVEDSETPSPNTGSILVGDPVSKLNGLWFEQEKQTNPKTAVNVYGIASIERNGSEEKANVTLAPAISRYEIAEVKAKSAANGVIALTSFKLAGIYINNTYKKCGTDYSTLPTDADILDYSDDTAFAFDAYPKRFCSEWETPEAGTSFTPTSDSHKWSYYVLPVIAEKGTTINGVEQTSVPHIVLKITDAKAEVTAYDIPATTYVTIKELKVGNTPLTALERGKVYSIASIEIGGENLASTPETSAIESIEVTATVTDWEGINVNPVVPGITD